MRRKVEFTEPETAVAPLPGRDGWLFLTGDSNDVIAQHTGAFVPDRRWARRWSRQLRGRARLMRRLGVIYVQMVVPDKEAVYADLLPPEIVPAPSRPVHRLIELAGNAGVELIYPLDQLRAGRRTGVIYHPTDTHWTARGAYLGYRAACDALGPHLPGLRVVREDEVEWVEDTRAGDLGSKLDPPLRGTGVRARLDSRACTVDDNLIYVTGRRLTTESPGEDGPSCVIFGTSYSVFTLLFFAETFRRMVFVHSTAIDRETVSAERPDVVMAITSERGLRRPPDDRTAHEMLEQVVERKRREGRVSDPGNVELHGRVRLLPPPP